MVFVARYAGEIRHALIRDADSKATIVRVRILAHATTLDTRPLPRHRNADPALNYTHYFVGVDGPHPAPCIPASLVSKCCHGRIAVLGKTAV